MYEKKLEKKNQEMCAYFHSAHDYYYLIFFMLKNFSCLERIPIS